MSSNTGNKPPKTPAELKKGKKESTPVKEEKPKKEPENGEESRHGTGRRDRGEQRGEQRERYRRGGRGHSYGGQGRGGFRGQGDRGDSNRQRDGGYQQGYQQHSQYQEEPSMFPLILDDTPKEPKKFTGRCRLFVGNITPDTTEEQFKEMFTPYGEVSELFVNAAKGFGFIRLDYRINAEKAKVELDGQMRNNRVLRVRFATHGAALKVFNLSLFVSNELLESAFSQFGEVERAVVIVDDRGRSSGEGIVEFARKPGATAAMKRINDGIFLMSSSHRPIRVEQLDQKDEEDGLTEKFVQRNDGFRMDREKEPRFAQPGSFEFEFGMKHRRIDEMEREGIERVKQEMEMERKRLGEEMETAAFDYQAEQIRQDLLRQQEELKRLEEMKNEQIRRRQEMDMRRQEERMKMAENDRRRQEMMMRNVGGMGMSRDGLLNREGNMGREGQMGREFQMGRDGVMREGGMRDAGGMREGGMREGQMGPGMPGGNREREEMMMRAGQQMSPGSRGNRSGGPGTPPMPPPPVPPGMTLEQQQQQQQQQQQNRGQQQEPGMENRFSGGASGALGQGEGGPAIGEQPAAELQRPGQFEAQGNQFQRGQGGNFPNAGMGNMIGGAGGNQGGMFQKMQGNMGNNPNMGGNDRRRGEQRREDFGDMKRMRRY